MEWDRGSRARPGPLPLEMNHGLNESDLQSSNQSNNEVLVHSGRSLSLSLGQPRNLALRQFM